MAQETSTYFELSGAVMGKRKFVIGDMVKILWITGWTGKILLYNPMENHERPYKVIISTPKFVAGEPRWFSAKDMEKIIYQRSLNEMVK